MAGQKIQKYFCSSKSMDNSFGNKGIFLYIIDITYT